MRPKQMLEVMTEPTQGPECRTAVVVVVVVVALDVVQHTVTLAAHLRRHECLRVLSCMTVCPS
jgi:hypothetical protein